ncbi:T9SS type A sorting domain-containing protein [bacterium]|nr:T9SS type A sorting domain-containing protein [bacterium]
MFTQFSKKILFTVILPVICYSQVHDLDSLYVSQPSDSEFQSIVNNFNIVLDDGDEALAKWSLYDPYLFNPDSSAPSIFPLINKLRVIREQLFSKPLPFADNNVYEYMHSHFSNGGIELSLRTGNNMGGGNWMYLSAVNAFWDPRLSSDPLVPHYPFCVIPYVYGTQLYVHETRHSEPDDPGHVDGNKDLRLADEGGYGRACIYMMWIWKYGVNNSLQVKMAAACEAKKFLSERFVEQPPNHPNLDVQNLIDELLQTPIYPVKADAGSDQIVTVPAGEDSATVILDGSASYDVIFYIAEYHWHSDLPYYDIHTDTSRVEVKLAPGTYHFELNVFRYDGMGGGCDTVTVTVKPNAPSTNHFLYAITNEQYPIYVRSIICSDIEEEDEIAVYTMANVCAGAVFCKKTEDLIIWAWKDDEETTEIDGFQLNGYISFRFWDASEQLEYYLTRECRSGQCRWGEGYTEVSLTRGMPVLVNHPESDKGTPKRYCLNQNYPNPFNPITTINFGLPKRSEVKINVLNVGGQLVKEIYSGTMQAGYHSVIWDASHNSAGTYLIKMVAEDFVQVKKCILLK